MDDLEIEEHIQRCLVHSRWTGRGSLIAPSGLLDFMIYKQTRGFPKHSPVLEFREIFGLRASRWVDNSIPCVIINLSSDDEAMLFFLATGARKPNAKKDRRSKQTS
jgi:hypothetical protein